MQPNINRTARPQLGGWLFALVICLIYVSPILGGLRLAAGFARLDASFAGYTSYTNYKVGWWIMFAFHSYFGVMAGITLQGSGTADALQKAKKFLYLRLITGALGALSLETLSPFHGLSDALFDGIINALIGSVYIVYLNKSERVRLTYLWQTESDRQKPVVPPGSPTPTAAPAAASIKVTETPITYIKSKEQHVILPIDLNKIYTVIAAELETGTHDKGLWIRLYAECDGDETKTKVRYIKERAAGLQNAEEAKRQLEMAAQLAALKQQEDDLRRSQIPEYQELVTAVRNGEWNTAKRLLDAGVKPDGRDSEGNSLIDIANKRSDKMMADLLKYY